MSRESDAEENPFLKLINDYDAAKKAQSQEAASEETPTHAPRVDAAKILAELVSSFRKLANQYAESSTRARSLKSSST